MAIQRRQITRQQIFRRGVRTTSPQYTTETQTISQTLQGGLPPDVAPTTGYTVVQEGNLFRYDAPAQEYRISKIGDKRKYGTFIPRTVYKDAQGRIIKEIIRDDYASKKTKTRTERDVYVQKINEFYPDGSLKAQQVFDTYQKREGRYDTYREKEKKFIDGKVIEREESRSNWAWKKEIPKVSTIKESNIIVPKTNVLAVTRKTEDGTVTVTRDGEVTLRNAKGKIVDRYMTSKAEAVEFVKKEDKSIRDAVETALKTKNIKTYQERLIETFEKLGKDPKVDDRGNVFFIEGKSKTLISPSGNIITVPTSAVVAQSAFGLQQRISDTKRRAEYKEQKAKYEKQLEAMQISQATQDRIAKQIAASPFLQRIVATQEREAKWTKQIEDFLKYASGGIDFSSDPAYTKRYSEYGIIGKGKSIAIDLAKSIPKFIVSLPYIPFIVGGRLAMGVDALVNKQFEPFKQGAKDVPGEVISMFNPKNEGFALNVVLTAAGINEVAKAARASGKFAGAAEASSRQITKQVEKLLKAGKIVRMKAITKPVARGMRLIKRTGIYKVGKLEIPFIETIKVKASQVPRAITSKVLSGYTPAKASLARLAKKVRSRVVKVAPVIRLTTKTIKKLRSETRSGNLQRRITATERLKGRPLSIAERQRIIERFQKDSRKLATASTKKAKTAKPAKLTATQRAFLKKSLKSGNLQTRIDAATTLKGRPLSVKEYNTIIKQFNKDTGKLAKTVTRKVKRTAKRRPSIVQKLSRTARLKNMLKSNNLEQRINAATLLKGKPLSISEYNKLIVEFNKDTARIASRYAKNPPSIRKAVNRRILNEKLKSNNLYERLTAKAIRKGTKLTFDEIKKAVLDYRKDAAKLAKERARSVFLNNLKRQKGIKGKISYIVKRVKSRQLAKTMSTPEGPAIKLTPAEIRSAEVGAPIKVRGQTKYPFIDKTTGTARLFDNLKTWKKANKFQKRFIRKRLIAESRRVPLEKPPVPLKDKVPVSVLSREQIISARAGSPIKVQGQARYPFIDRFTKEVRLFKSRKDWRTANRMQTQMLRKRMIADSRAPVTPTRRVSVVRDRVPANTLKEAQLRAARAGSPINVGGRTRYPFLDRFTKEVRLLDSQKQWRAANKAQARMIRKEFVAEARKTAPKTFEDTLSYIRAVRTVAKRARKAQGKKGTISLRDIGVISRKPTITKKQAPARKPQMREIQSEGQILLQEVKQEMIRKPVTIVLLTEEQSVRLLRALKQARQSKIAELKRLKTARIKRPSAKQPTKAKRTGNTPQKFIQKSRTAIRSIAKYGIMANTVARSIQKTRATPTLKFVSVAIPADKVITDVTSAVRIKPIQAVKQSQVQLPAQDQAVVQKQATAQLPKQTTVTTTAQRQALRQKQLQTLVMRRTARQQQQGRLLTKESFEELAKGKGVDVYVKKAGAKSKYTRVNAKPLFAKSAENFGRYITDNLPLASYRLIITKKKPQMSFTRKASGDKFRQIIGKTKLPSRTVVEKRKYRLDKPGEKMGLSLAKLRATRTQKGIIALIKSKTAPKGKTSKKSSKKGLSVRRTAKTKRK